MGCENAASPRITVLIYTVAQILKAHVSGTTRTRAASQTMVCSPSVAWTAAVICVACFDRGARAFVYPSSIGSVSAERTVYRHRTRDSIRRTESRRIERPLARSAGGSGNDDHDNVLYHDEHVLSRRQLGSILGGLGSFAALNGVVKDAFADEEEASSSPVDTAPAAGSETAEAPLRTGPLLRDMGLEVPYTGKNLPLDRFLGSKATLVVNPKIDDPESLNQVRYH